MPWTAGQVDAIRCELPGRYKAMTDTGRYLGLRQGEIFGLSLDEIDWLHRVVHVGHQVKLFKTVTPVYGPPKGGKHRDVPLPHQAAEALAAHLERFPAAEITLPWQSPDGRPRMFALVFTGDKGGPCNRAAFNSKIWVPARRRAEIPDRAEVEGGAGMHQLRHHFASLLLRAERTSSASRNGLATTAPRSRSTSTGTSCPTITRRRCGRSRRYSRRPSARHQTAQ